MVEALTIIVASGTARGWRSAFEGAAVAVLAAIVGMVGVPLIHLVPISALRVLMGLDSPFSWHELAPQADPAIKWPHRDP